MQNVKIGFALLSLLLQCPAESSDMNKMEQSKVSKQVQRKDFEYQLPSKLSSEVVKVEVHSPVCRAEVGFFQTNIIFSLSYTRRGKRLVRSF